MGEKSAIEWTTHTWNPWQGCRKVSAGCKYCYMFRDKKRYGQDPNNVHRSSPATFNKPLHWEDPAMVFTCSWSDFFIEESDAWRNDALRIILATPHLQYQVLTKRPERVLPWMAQVGLERWPENVWMGISTEDQEQANKRIPILLEIPAAIRWLSCEPLLGPIYLDNWRGIDWVVSGGESGYAGKFRPADHDWFRSLRNQCEYNAVAFFHKQNGGDVRKRIDGHFGGRLLDGRTHDEFPEYAVTQ